MRDDCCGGRCRWCVREPETAWCEQCAATVYVSAHTCLARNEESTELEGSDAQRTVALPQKDDTQ